MDLPTADGKEVENAHRVVISAINFDGSRYVTGHVDHKVRVYHRNPTTREMILTDTFSAHNTDVKAAKWFHTMTGTNFATLGNDMLCKIWTEDLTMEPNSGRRFRCQTILSATNKCPFVCLDTKSFSAVSSYLAVIDRQGQISVYSPPNPDSFREWGLLDTFPVVTPPPPRGEETSFKVQFDPNVASLAYAQNLTDEKRMLSLVATAGADIRIFRSAWVSPAKKEKADGEEALRDDSDPHKKRLVFFEALRIQAHDELIRDVSWAPFNVRGTDLIAIGVKNGSVVIYELEVAPSDTTSSHDPSNASVKSKATTITNGSQRSQQSSLTTAIVGRPALINPTQQSAARPHHDFTWSYKLIDEDDLGRVHRDAWTVAWDPSGQMLMSCGYDGYTKMWRKSVVENQWMLFSDEIVYHQTDSEDEDTDKEDATALNGKTRIRS